MPQELDSNYPHVTPEEWSAMEAPRDVLAARLVMTRRVTGIPQRAYLTGSADEAPVVKGVADLTKAVYGLLDAIDAEGNSVDGDVHGRAATVRDIMETFNV